MFRIILLAIMGLIILGCAATIPKVPVSLDSNLPEGCNNCRSLGPVSDSDWARNRGDQIEGLKNACRDMGGNHVVVQEDMLYSQESIYTLMGKCYLCNCQ